MKQDETMHQFVIDGMKFQVVTSTSESMTIYGLQPCGYQVKFVSIVGDSGTLIGVNLHQLPLDIADQIHKNINNETP